MGKWINADYIKAVMKGDRLMQGNCEYELWKQEVDRQVNALPHIELDDYVPKDFHDKTCEAMAKAHQAEILELTADRPQGEWIRTFDGNEWFWYCSNCKEQWYEDDLWMGGNEFPHYCPNCGAKMKGADDEV